MTIILLLSIPMKSHIVTGLAVLLIKIMFVIFLISPLIDFYLRKRGGKR